MRSPMMGVGWLAAALLLAGPAVAQGQGGGGGQSGGQSGGRPGDPAESEPVPAQVAKKEQRAGVAPSPAQARQTDQALEDLNRKLLRDEQTRPPKAASAPGGGG